MRGRYVEVVRPGKTRSRYQGVRNQANGCKGEAGISGPSFLHSVFKIQGMYAFPSCRLTIGSRVNYIISKATLKTSLMIGENMPLNIDLFTVGMLLVFRNSQKTR